MCMTPLLDHCHIIVRNWSFISEIGLFAASLKEVLTYFQILHIRGVFHLYQLYRVLGLCDSPFYYLWKKRFTKEEILICTIQLSSILNNQSSYIYEYSYLERTPSEAATKMVAEAKKPHTFYKANNKMCLSQVMKMLTWASWACPKSLDSHNRLSIFPLKRQICF